MPILYTVVARGTTVLVKHAACAGNFSEVTEQVLNKIPAEDSRLTYSHGSFLFHYVKQDGVVYLCITDDDFERSKAFMYLADIKMRFVNTYGLPRIREALPYGMNTDFASLLASEMKRYSEARDLDAISRVQNDLQDVKNIMVKNIDNITARGEHLELLVNKAENLNAASVSFRKTSRNVASAMYWRNIKFSIIVAAVCLLVLYIIISISCGGLLWGNCIGGGNTPAPTPTPAPVTTVKPTNATI